MAARVLLTVEEAVVRYRFPSRKALYHFVRTHPRVPVLRRGRVLLIDPDKWDAAFTEGAQS
jgi:hypothetical protein